MSDKLKSVKYNGCYFDRREEEAVRLCTTEGWFSCQVSSALPRAESWFQQAVVWLAATWEEGNGYWGACVVQHQAWQGDVIARVICLWLVIASGRTALG